VKQLIIFSYGFIAVAFCFTTKDTKGLQRDYCHTIYFQIVTIKSTAAGQTPLL